MHDERGLLDICANAQEGEKPHPTFNRFYPVKERNLTKNNSELISIKIGEVYKDFISEYWNKTLVLVVLLYCNLMF